MLEVGISNVRNGANLRGSSTNASAGMAKDGVC